MTFILGCNPKLFLAECRRGCMSDTAPRPSTNNNEEGDQNGRQMFCMSEYIGVIIATANIPTNTAMIAMSSGSMSLDISPVA